MEELTIEDLLIEFNTSYFPPTKRERVIKRLIAAGKLKRNEATGKLIVKVQTPLELIKEKFELEAHILNQTVIVDDGTERKVYSTCVFETVKRYNCHVCVSVIYGKTSLICHNKSKKHYTMMLRITHPHQNFDEHQIMDLDPGSKTLSMSDCYILREFLDVCRSKNINMHLIGLEYLVEVLDPRNPYYHCLLCDKKTYDMFNTMDHLQSVVHRMTYLMLFFPKVYQKLVLLKKDMKIKELWIVVRKIVNKFGRLKPWCHEGALSLKQKRAIRHAIDCGPHIRDDADLSFAEDIVFNEMVKNERVVDTVITEFVVNESEDLVTDVYERQKGGIYRCKLCRVRVDSLIEKITHPYTGRHLEHTVKGIAIYDSIQCEIQSVFDSFPQPLIGTEYIVEYDEQGVFLYHCMLCRKSMNNSDMVTSHLVSKAHRQRYIKHHMPKKDEELLKLSGPVRAEKIESLLKQIEAKYGRLPPWGCLHSLDHKVDSKRTVKDLISVKIMDGKHLTVDERGVPRLIEKMPVPLFPKEGESAPDTAAQPKKKKKSKKRRSRSVSPSSRRRRSSSSSSESLSPVARQRGLSPEPVPSAYLPQEEMPPPAVVRKWLENTPSDTLEENTSQIDRIEKKLNEFFIKCDEDNWEKRINDPNHKCCPVFKDPHPFLEEWTSDERERADYRRGLALLYLKEKLLVGENSYTIDDLVGEIKNPKVKLIVSLLDNGTLCTEPCRPLCGNVVQSTLEILAKELPEVEELEEEDLIMITCLGLVHLSNFFHFLYVTAIKKRLSHEF